MVSDIYVYPVWHVLEMKNQIDYVEKNVLQMVHTKKYTNDKDHVQNFVESF